MFCEKFLHTRFVTGCFYSIPVCVFLGSNYEPHPFCHHKSLVSQGTSITVVVSSLILSKCLSDKIHLSNTQKISFYKVHQYHIKLFIYIIFIIKSKATKMFFELINKQYINANRDHS